MQTYTHFFMTFYLERRLRNRPKTTLPPINRTGFLIGSCAPDAPLTLVAMGCIASDMIRQRQAPEGVEVDSLTRKLFGDLFFNSPLIKAVHNIFHAPLLTLFYMLFGWGGWRAGKAWGAPLFWFGSATTLHTSIDIPLHHNDGPLLFFPFEWETRYISPLSYWDPAHYGRQFAIFEHALLLVILFALVRDWLAD